MRGRSCQIALRMKLLSVEFRNYLISIRDEADGFRTLRQTSYPADYHCRIRLTMFRDRGVVRWKGPREPWPSVS